MLGRGWFFSLVLASLIYASAKASVTEHTYQHEGRTCSRCPPGLYMKTRCTKSQDTICAPCPANHYTQFWNYVQKCQYCNNFCQENQYVKLECNQFHNRVCECKDGYFWKYEFCMKQAECPRGFGVKTAGTPLSNTVCVKCPPGFFSSVSSATMQCKRHTNCTELGLELDIAGTAWHDNLCNPCQPHESEEGTSECEAALFYFVVRQNIKQKKLLQLGKVLTILSQDDIRQIKNGKLQILPLLKKWKMQRGGSISAEDLVKALREVKLNKIAKKVAKKFLKYENNAVCALPEK
ncbi:tumor necrosis factor receptor superfamily member 11B-like [Pristis pectinata]|uniref:tumor necrosis factor receptor superfamily member 11B-like n=1 Tax=Pristis pectinata TaxID=685728 RepID=UPI00223DD39C|nr:tumor necrosis factor receptor superfamily member 11B-like [Pristis pectinata]